MLADKDAAGMVAALAPVLDASSAPRSRPRRCTRRAGPGARSRPPATRRDRLAAGLEAEAEPRPREALARARELAEAAGGILLVTGSHYLLAPARAALRSETVRATVRRDSRMSSKSAGSELLSMMALVAAVVAAVILIFFGLGFLFGRLFL